MNCGFLLIYVIYFTIDVIHKQGDKWYHLLILDPFAEHPPHPPSTGSAAARYCWVLSLKINWFFKRAVPCAVTNTSVGWFESRIWLVHIRYSNRYALCNICTLTLVPNQIILNQLSTYGSALNGLCKCLTGTYYLLHVSIFLHQVPNVTFTQFQL